MTMEIQLVIQNGFRNRFESLDFHDEFDISVRIIVTKDSIELVKVAERLE